MIRKSTLEIRCQHAFSRLVEYLCSKQSSRGGFGTYHNIHVDDSNLTDTHFAIQLFRLMHHELPQMNRITSFLESYPVSTHVHQILYFVEALRTLHPDAVIPKLWRVQIETLAIQPPPSGNLTNWFDRALTIIRLKKMIKQNHDIDPLLGWLAQLNQTRFFEFNLSTLDTYFAFQLLLECGLPLPKHAPDLVNEFQRLPAGFSISRNSNSPRLESLYTGIALCKRVNIPIKYPLAIEDFVLACQCSNGGFSSAPAALPSIENSYKAVWILEKLSEFKNSVQEVTHTLIQTETSPFGRVEKIFASYLNNGTFRFE